MPELSYALAARNAKGVSLLDGQDTFVVRTAQTGANGHGVSDVAHTLDGANGQAVTHSLTVDGFDASEDGTGRGTPRAAVGASVRRLTPVECERLQGLPDGWTDVGGMADGPRYRMLGNAVVTYVAQWICERIKAVENQRSMTDEA